MPNFIFEKVSDLPVVYVQNFFSPDELNLIFLELEYLKTIDRFKLPEDPDGPGTAYSNGSSLKVGKGLHLDAVYQERNSSDILNVNRKLFSDTVTERLISLHPFFRYVKRSNKDSTKLHYFQNGDHYKSHIDDCVVTAVSWFYKNPKSFSGGDLVLENRVIFPCLNNSMIIFPSIAYHEVTEVVMSDIPDMGRYSMSQFLYM